MVSDSVVLCIGSALVIRFVVDFVFQAEDGIRDLVRSRGLGDVYKRQLYMLGVKAIHFMRRRNLN